MRLTAAQIQTIQRAACQFFGADAAVWLFGSRTDDRKKGGDYDFLIETSLDSPDALIQQKIAMLLAYNPAARLKTKKLIWSSNTATARLNCRFTPSRNNKESSYETR